MNNYNEILINSLKVFAAEAVEKAQSGHPGMPLGSAPLTFELWENHLRFNPNNPDWINRDRFVLSAGHASMLLYALLFVFGYELSVDDIRSFRQWGSKTPGHPEYKHTPGVEATTGPLGQGFSNAVGIAIAEEYLATKFNRPGYNLIDHYTYVLSGDGCMMEGITSEAASLAGTLGLGKLIVFYDSNAITIEGDTAIAFREDVGRRFEAYNWQVLKVTDGNDLQAIHEAIETAKGERTKPTLIIVTTQIASGAPPKQGTAAAHGEPLGDEAIKALKKSSGWPWSDTFHISAEVKTNIETYRQRGVLLQKAWEKLFKEYYREFPTLADEWQTWFTEIDAVKLGEVLGSVTATDQSKATRVISAEILNRIVNFLPNLIGGAADLAPSTKTKLTGKGDFSKENRQGSNLHFGVREHAMAAITNGIALHGGLIPYCSTFLVFLDYMKGAVRLSALMGLPVIYILTHDSIGVGEDGPTHQPIEQLASLRAIPNFTVIRPADARETAAAWYMALTKKDGPTALILTRQNLPTIESTSLAACKGAYIVMDSAKAIPDLILMASGSELQLAVDSGKALQEKGLAIRVVSMPSWEWFEAQDKQYQQSVLPREVRKRLAIEAGSSFGWHKYTGLDGTVIAIDKFGASAPGETVFKEYGFTVTNVVKKAMELMEICEDDGDLIKNIRS
jgi:transketolase